MASSGLRQFFRDITLYLVVLLFIVTLGPLQFGFHLAELNAPQDVITCKKKAIPHSLKNDIVSFLRSKPKPVEGPYPDCIPMDDAKFATISALFTIGGFLGALASGPYASKFGRLSAMRITAMIYIIGAALETLAGSVPLLGAGRLVAGIGAGAATVVVPLYINEISPPKERGFFGTMTQISVNVGILLTQTLGYFLSHGNAWRGILGAGLVIAVVQLVGLFFVPETPAWLAANGDTLKARSILQRIRGHDYDIKEETQRWAGEPTGTEEEGLLSQARGTDQSSRGEESVNLSFFQVVKDPLYRPAIVAVVAVMFAQQLGGINAVVMYSVSLLTGLLPISSGLLTILVSIVNLVITAACSPLPDKLGRKRCILISIVGQGLSSLALALSIRFGVKLVSAVAVVTFVGFFAVGLGPVPFMLASELVGQEAVGATQSWSIASNYLATFLVAQFFPIVNSALNDALGGAGWVFFMFAGFALFFALFISWKVPETKGKKDADEVWGRTRRLD